MKQGLFETREWFLLDSQWLSVGHLAKGGLLAPAPDPPMYRENTPLPAIFGMLMCYTYFGEGPPGTATSMSSEPGHN